VKGQPARRGRPSRGGWAFRRAASLPGRLLTFPAKKSRWRMSGPRQVSRGRVA